MSVLPIGAAFPAFALADQHGALHTEAALAEGPAVVYFYPKDETPGCTRQACALRDHAADFAARGARLFGVSADDVASHAGFAAHHGLGFALLADVDHALSAAVGVWGLQTWGAHTWEGIARTTFVLQGGRVAAVFEQVEVERHAEQVLAALDGLVA